MSEQRHCVDCRWHSGVVGFNVCVRVVAGNVVTGPQPLHEFCASERYGGGEQHCGKKGQYWEPKPLPFWRRWFA